MDSSVVDLASLVVGLALWAYFKEPTLPLKGLRLSLGLAADVWLPLSLGFCLAGLANVLLPHEVLIRLMGEQAGFRGILVGWLLGLLMPGGPDIVFPIAASLLQRGVGVGPLLAFITAKTLLSPIRMFSWEIPFLGWPFTLARVIPSVLFPPLIGVIGQRLFHMFSR